MPHKMQNFVALPSWCPGRSVSFSPGVFLATSDCRGRESVYGWPLVTRETQTQGKQWEQCSSWIVQCLPQSPTWRALEKQPGVNIRVSIHIYSSLQREEHFIHRSGRRLDGGTFQYYLRQKWRRLIVLYESELVVSESWEMNCICVYNSCFDSVYLRNNEQSVDSRTYGMNQQQLEPIYSHCTTLKQYILWYHSRPHTYTWRLSHTLYSCFYR